MPPNARANGGVNRGRSNVQGNLRAAPQPAVRSFEFGYATPRYAAFVAPVRLAQLTAIPDLAQHSSAG